jgi:hypothetical protein
LIIPSRGRPAAAAEAVESALTNARQQFFGGGSVRIIVAVDDDDAELPAYREALGKTKGVDLTVGPRVRMGPTLNREARRVAGTFDIVGFMGDDHRIRTVGWNLIVGTAMREPGVVYGNDLMHGPELPTAAFIASPIIRGLGYIVPPGLVHLYLDNFWLDLGRATALRYVPRLVIEHLHPLAGKAEWDAGYQSANDAALYERDRQEYERYLAEDWPKEKAKLGLADA